MKPDRVRFMLFLRVLFKYLQVRKNDQNYTHERLKLALHECAQKSRRGDAGYENLTAAMQRTIPQVVSEQDLAKAREYMKIFMKQHYNTNQGGSELAFQQHKIEKRSPGLTVRDPNTVYISAFSTVGGNY